MLEYERNLVDIYEKLGLPKLRLGGALRPISRLLHLCQNLQHFFTSLTK
jgi:hypothetical protein